MRVLLAALALALPTSAIAMDGSNWATAVVSPGLVAQRATLTLKLHFQMTCGRPGVGPVTIRLPGTMQVTRSLAVRIGMAPAPATVSGNQVIVQLPTPHGVTCMSIGPGTLTLYLAGVRNPASAGTYFVRARLRTMAFTAQLAVRS
jgi:hypothetical protein